MNDDQRVALAQARALAEAGVAAAETLAQLNPRIVADYFGAIAAATERAQEAMN